MSSRVGMGGILLFACAITIAVWLASYRWSLQTAWRSNGRQYHLTIRGGTLWLTRGGEPSALPGARPLIVVPSFGAMIRRNQAAEQYLRTHAAFLRSCLGADDVEAAAEIARADALRSSLHAEILAQIDGPVGELIVAEVAPTVATFLGVSFESGTGRLATRQPDGAIGYGLTTVYSAMGIPCWMLASALGFLPTLTAAIRLWRIARVQSRPGLCATCGYDMRATPDRCPECGTTPAQSLEAATQGSL